MSDPTRVDLTIDGGGLDPTVDPFTAGMSGRAIHGNTPFQVPWISHIVDGLYTGGCTNGLVIPDVIDSICSLYRWEQYTIPLRRDVDVFEIEMFDAEGPVDTEAVETAVDWVMGRLDAGCNVLVHCQAGLNRSGMVAARVLTRMGFTPSEAVAQLRAKRSPAVLCNQAFEDYVLAQ